MYAHCAVGFSFWLRPSVYSVFVLLIVNYKAKSYDICHGNLSVHGNKNHLLYLQVKVVVFQTPVYFKEG